MGKPEQMLKRMHAIRTHLRRGIVIITHLSETDASTTVPYRNGLAGSSFVLCSIKSILYDIFVLENSINRLSFLKKKERERESKEGQKSRSTTKSA